MRRNSSVESLVEGTFQLLMLIPFIAILLVLAGFIVVLGVDLRKKRLWSLCFIGLGGPFFFYVWNNSPPLLMKLLGITSVLLTLGVLISSLIITLASPNSPTSPNIAKEFSMFFAEILLSIALLISTSLPAFFQWPEGFNEMAQSSLELVNYSLRYHHINYTTNPIQAKLNTLTNKVLKIKQEIKTW